MIANRIDHTAKRRYSLRASLLWLLAACILPAISVAVNLAVVHYRLLHDQIHHDTTMLAREIAANQLAGLAVQVEGAGEMESFLSDGLRTLLETMPEVPNMSERTLRWPGHVDAIRPLVASGRLVQRAARRLTETGRFIVETCKPGGLARSGAGFQITVRVRLMHAQVRRQLLVGSWPVERWGVPINQAHMAGTNILFSALFIEGLRGIGYEMPEDDRADLIHLWRYIGLLSGVNPSLCAANEADALRLRDLLTAITPPPDDDSRALVRALMESPLAMAETDKERAVARRITDFMWGVSRHLVGEEYAEALRYPRTPWTLMMRPLRAWNALRGVLGRHTRHAGDPFYRIGLSSWERLIAHGIGGIPISFDFLGASIGHR